MDDAHHCEGTSSMMVEFVGSTGSGKTTLISQIQSRLANRTRVVTAYQLVAGRLGLGGVTNPTVQNLIQELIGFPFCVHSLRRHRAFLALTIRLFTRDAPLSFATIHNLRSLERKMGVYEMAQRYNRDAIILVDEGPLQAAHMFVFTTAGPTPEEITQFAQRLPLPDLVVYVRSPVDALVERTRRRSDPPRQMRSEGGDIREGYIRSAVALFEVLVREENLRNRCLIVENPDCSQPEYNKRVDEIAAAILNHQLALQRPGHANAPFPAT
jgi:thymidylate kinase